MKLPEAVQSAADAKAAAELKPIQDRLAKLRATVDAYEVHVRQDVERKVSNAVLAALGLEPAAEDASLPVVAKELKAALVDVAGMLDVVLDIPVVVTVPAPPPPPPTPRPPRKLRDDDVLAASKLLSEIDALRPDVKAHHHTRLAPLLQAITAEIKMLLERLPQDHDLFDRLGKAIGVVNALRVEGGVDTYIKGLAFGSHADWERIAFRNRRQVANYDRDTAKPVREPAPGSLGAKLKAAQVKATKPEPEPTSYQWPDWPKLRGLDKPILLAGGMIIPEKLKSIQERFGLTVEWHEIDHDNPRAAGTLLTRIRGGKVGAIIILEEFMKHSTYEPLIKACTSSNVVYAMGDKAGVAALQTAFENLERKLGGC